MATAIIVSGVMRHMANASSSWPWKENYFLHIDNIITKPQSFIATGFALDRLSTEIKQCKVKFKSITIDIDTINKHIIQKSIPRSNLYRNPILNMLWKWKSVFSYIKLFNTFNIYDRIFITRPDVYIDLKAPISIFDEMTLEDNTLYTTGPMVKVPNDDRNVETMGDVCLGLNFQTMEKLSNFYDYYLVAVDNIGITRHDVHSLMAAFVMENSIRLDTKLNEILQFAVLRDNSSFMFENGVLRPEYKFWDLVLKQKEWWDNDLKSKGIIT